MNAIFSQKRLLVLWMLVVIYYLSPCLSFIQWYESRYYHKFLQPYSLLGSLLVSFSIASNSLRRESSSVNDVCSVALRMPFESAFGRRWRRKCGPGTRTFFLGLFHFFESTSSLSEKRALSPQRLSSLMLFLEWLIIYTAQGFPTLLLAT